MKKFTILTLLIIASRLLSFGQLPNITASEIKYWVGSGTNEAILVIYYYDENPDDAYAWGYRWNGSKTVAQMLSEINNADNRLNIEGVSSGYIEAFEYNDPIAGLNFDGWGNFGWMYSVNTEIAAAVSSQPVLDGDVVTFYAMPFSPGNPGNFGTFSVIPVPNPTPTTTYTIHSGFGGEYATEAYGSISHVGDSIVGEGSNITYTFTPNPGYHVGSVTLGGVEKIQDVVNNSYTIENIMQDDTLWVLFAVDKNNTVTGNDIVYWIGEGSNEVIFAVNWCDPQVAFAWGYRFNGEKVLVSKVMEDIKAVDSRFDYTHGGGMISDITYNDNSYNLALAGGYWMYNVNEESVDKGFETKYVYPNDIIEFGDESCGLSDDFWNNVWTTAITPVSEYIDQSTYTIHAQCGVYGTISPMGDSTVAKGSNITYTFTPVDGYHAGSLTIGGVEKIQDVVNNSYTVSNVIADDTVIVLFAVDKNNTVTSNDIVYWIGEGTNEVIFAVNWCEPEIAFAWGYRFNGEKVLVSKVMEDIKAADSRFDYTDGGGYITEITYQDSIYNLALAGDYWMYNVNEGYADGINNQYVFHNDIIEFGDESCGLSDDFWTYVWTTAITPVSVPSTTSIVSIQQAAIHVSLYPNPANDYTYLSIDGIEGNISMKIVDISGKIIRAEQFYVNNNTVKQIETATFAKGIYFIHLQNNNRSQTQKLIVY